MLLSLDTSTRSMGLALYDGARLLAESGWMTADHHTVELAPAVEQTLRRCGVKMSAVTAVGVALGPGSFTGLRIGLALAKGLALARRIPLIGIPSLDVVAAGIPLQAGERLSAVLPAGRGRLAVGSYQSRAAGWAFQPPLQVMTIQELCASLQPPAVLCGELTPEERKFVSAWAGGALTLASPAQCVRRPALLAELAWARWQTGQVDDPALLSPIYLQLGGGLPEAAASTVR